MSDTPIENTNAPDGFIGPATRLFQITEPELEEMERILPDLCDRLYGQLGKNQPGATKLRKQLSKMKEIISDVRWSHGPPADVGIIEA